jgi:arylamine N-acetyltransferase
MAPAAPVAPPTYSHTQLKAFFNHISLPTSERIFDIASPALSSAERLQYLTLLQKLTLVTVPFENLSIHYSKSHAVDLDKDVLWEKVVGRSINGGAGRRKRSGGRGGYCMENNRFFGVVLYSLGFDVYAAGARVKSPEGFGGW